jgi:Cytochrome c554 and c-prime
MPPQSVRTPDLSHHARALRPILESNHAITTCFACHATGVGTATDVSGMQPGVRCERCHGPGRQHVESAKSGAPLQQVRAAVVNPGRFQAKARVEAVSAIAFRAQGISLRNRRARNSPIRANRIDGQPMFQGKQATSLHHVPRSARRRRATHRDILFEPLRRLPWRCAAIRIQVPAGDQTELPAMPHAADVFRAVSEVHRSSHPDLLV